MPIGQLPSEDLPPRWNQQQAEHQPERPADRGIGKDRTLEDARDLCVVSAKQMDDLDRVAIAAQGIARGEPDRRCARESEQADQCERHPAQRG